MRWLPIFWRSLVGHREINPDVLAQLEAVLASHDRMVIRWRLSAPQTLDQWKARYPA